MLKASLFQRIKLLFSSKVVREMTELHNEILEFQKTIDHNLETIAQSQLAIAQTLTEIKRSIGVFKKNYSCKEYKENV